MIYYKIKLMFYVEVLIKFVVNLRLLLCVVICIFPNISSKSKQNTFKISNHKNESIYCLKYKRELLHDTFILICFKFHSLFRGFFYTEKNHNNQLIIIKCYILCIIYTMRKFQTRIICN